MMKTLWLPRAVRAERDDVVRKLQERNDTGAIQLKTSSIVSRFRILDRMPLDEESKTDLVADISARMHERRRNELANIRSVNDQWIIIINSRA